MFAAFVLHSNAKQKLEDEYKRIKDHNNKSWNDHITFPYFDDINEVLGCKLRITPKKVTEQASACASASPCPSTPSVLKAVTPTRRNPKTKIMISLFLNRYSLSENRVIRERKPTRTPQLPRNNRKPKNQRRQRRLIRSLITSRFWLRLRTEITNSLKDYQKKMQRGS